MSKTFKVTLKKSVICCTDSQIRTIRALGLKKTHSSVEVKDNAANRGQLVKVQHLVEIEVKN